MMKKKKRIRGSGRERNWDLNCDPHLRSAGWKSAQPSRSVQPCQQCAAVPAAVEQCAAVKSSAQPCQQTSSSAQPNKRQTVQCTAVPTVQAVCVCDSFPLLDFTFTPQPSILPPSLPPFPLQHPASGSFPSLLHQSLHQITRAPETSLSTTNRLHPTPSGNMPSYVCVLSQLHPCIPLTDGKAGSPTSPHRTYLEPTAPLTPLPNRKAGSQPPLRGTLSRVLLGERLDGRG